MRTRIFPGWYVVAGCFLCLMLVSGTTSLAFPVFIKPLESAFGWTRTEVLGALALAAVVTGIISPVLGYWVDVLGARRVMLAGISVVGACFLAMGQMRSLVALYVIVLFIALGVSASTYIPVASVITQWFVRHRGLAMSVAMAGMGAGGFIMPNVANELIQWVGWRWTYRIFGLAVWAVLLSVIWRWLYCHPSDVGMKAYGEEEDRLPGSAGDSPQKLGQSPLMRMRRRFETLSVPDGYQASEAVRMFRFWALGLADMANGFAIIGVGVHLVPFSIESGITGRVAAFAYSLINFMVLLGAVTVGPAADKFNKRALLILGYGLPAAGILPLFHLDGRAGPLFAFVVLAGLSAAGKLTILPLVINDIFGKRAYATVLGFLTLFYSAGIAIAPPLTGYIFDSTKSYYWVFVITFAAFIVSAILVAFGARQNATRLCQES